MEIIFTLDEIQNAAEKFLVAVGENRVLAFYGKMGAGKTTFIKAVCQTLGVQETASSPTFAIVNEYQTVGSENVFHFDFYRLKSPAEALDFGVEEYLESGNFCLLEWPEIVEEILPNDILKIKISEIDNNKRKLNF